MSRSASLHCLMVYQSQTSRLLAYGWIEGYCCGLLAIVVECAFFTRDRGVILRAMPCFLYSNEIHHLVFWNFALRSAGNNE